MELLSLSKRLECLVNYIPQGSIVADIGTDHAFLPVYILQNKISSFAIAGELNRDPYYKALETVQSKGYGQQISVRLGNGLEIIRPGDCVNVLVIAGMGGNTIKNILADGQDKLKNIKKLILQPMVDGNYLRLWLANNGWKIVSEDLVEEDNKIYEIIAAAKGVETSSGIILELGPKLIENKHTLLDKYLRDVYQQQVNILKQLEKSTRLEIKNKHEKILNRLQQIKAAAHEGGVNI